MTKQEYAIALHDKGYNCAQAVACAFAEKMNVPESVIFQAAEGFGLGMGGMQATCGAISGAVLLAGFHNSTANLDGEKSKADTYRLSKQILTGFEQKNKVTLCKELKGIETGTVIRSCPDCIKDAVSLVEEILKL